MLTTRFVTGSPIWVDLGTPDLDGARSFYGALFGWEFAPAGPEAGGYGMFTREGRTVAGGMTVPPERGEPAWMLYFHTPDAEAVATAVRAGGGTVTLDPMDVLDLGRMALFTDPTGAGFGVWQPGANRGLDAVGEPGALCWTELYTPDPVADLSFYDMVFGMEAHTAAEGRAARTRCSGRPAPDRPRPTTRSAASSRSRATRPRRPAAPRGRRTSRWTTSKRPSRRPSGTAGRSARGPPTWRAWAAAPSSPTPTAPASRCWAGAAGRDTPARRSPLPGHRAGAS